METCEDQAMCMACETTWKEEMSLMLGHTWIQCDHCQCWIHEHCLPVGATYDSANVDAEFVCHNCESDNA